MALIKNSKTAEILIVEDETVVAMSIGDALVEMGHIVCGIASSFEQASILASTSDPDLVMMDIKIKGSIDGIETAQKIKELYNIPSIFITAYSDQDILERAKLAEPLGYILKPFKIDELKSVVQIALYKAEMETKIRHMNQKLEAAVIERTKELQAKTNYLRDSNEALCGMLKSREAERRAVEEDMLINIKRYVMPYIELIESEKPTEKILAATAMLKKTLNDIVSPISKTIFAKYINLTPQEIKIAEMIRDGKSTKDIAVLLNIAPSSVSTRES